MSVAIPAELAELADDTHRLVARCKDLIDRTENPSELHSIAEIAAAELTKAAGWIDLYIEHAIAIASKQKPGEKP